MDKLTHMSITNAIKELDALKALVVSGEFTFEEVSDFINEISWHLAGIFQRNRYNSDEFQHRLSGILQARKKKSIIDGNK